MKRIPLLHPPWLLQSFKLPLFVSWSSIKWSSASNFIRLSLNCFLLFAFLFLKHKSDHISLLKILRWFHFLHANIHIFQRDLKALHWSSANLPAPSFPIISQLHSPLLKYITHLYICSCCSIWIEPWPILFLLLLFQVLVQATSSKSLWSTRAEEEMASFSLFSKTSNLQHSLSFHHAVFVFPFVKLQYKYLWNHVSLLLDSESL